MGKDRTKPPDQRGMHGARILPGLSIDSYNLAIREPDGSGFVGDRASQTAFRDLLDRARKHNRTGKDPFGKEKTQEIGKKTIDLVMVGGDPDAAHLVHVAVEEYAQRLAEVVRCFLAQPEWEDVAGIVLGGGMPESSSAASPYAAPCGCSRKRTWAWSWRCSNTIPTKAACWVGYICCRKR